jgi:hypothetical protein
VTTRATTQNTTGRTNDGNNKRQGDAFWRSKGRLQRVDPRETRHDVSPGTNLFDGGMRDDPVSLQPEPKLFGSFEHIEAASDAPLSTPTCATLRRITVRATPLSLYQAAASPPEPDVDVGIGRHPIGSRYRQSPTERAGTAQCVSSGASNSHHQGGASRASVQDRDRGAEEAGDSAARSLRSSR